MLRPPRDPRESIFTPDVRLFALMAVLLETPLLLGVFLHDLGTITHARTELFFLLFVVEMVIALNFRSLRHSVFTAPPHGWLWASVAWEVLLLAGLLYLPPVRAAFGITLPSVADLTLTAVAAVLVFASMEGAKAFLRRKTDSTARLPGSG